MPLIPFVELDGPDFKDPIRLNTAQLVSFVYEESLSGCAKWALNLVEDDSNKFNRFIRMDGGAGKTFRFRYGLQGSQDKYPPTGQQISNWKTLELLQSRKRTVGRRVLFTFRGLCHGHVLNRRRKPNANWHQARICDIVQDLAEDAGLGHDVEQTVGQYSLSMGDCSSGYFIKHYLLPLAYSKAPSTAKDWRFWIRDGNTVVFKPTNISEAPKHKLSDNIKDDILILPLLGPESVKTVATQVYDGSGSLKMEAHDPLTNRYQWYEVNENNANFGYMGRGKPLPRQRSTAVTMTTNFTEKRNLWGKSTREQLRQEAETRFALNARGLYRMVSRVPFAVGMYPGDKARVMIKSGSSFEMDEGTGIWQIHTVRAVLTHGEIKAYVVLERRWESGA